MDPEGSRGRDHLRQTSQWRGRLGPFALVVLTLSALTAWPPWLLRPAGELDPSWQLALHLARNLHMAWGRDVVFSYGPLAFINSPNVITYWSLPLGFLYGALCVALLLLVPLWGFREFSAWTAVGVTAAFCLLAPTGMFVPELISVGVFATALLVFERPGAWRLDAVSACVGVVLSIQLLIKPPTAAVAGVALLVVVLADAPHRARRALAGAATSLGGTVVIWLLLGQSLADLPRWLHGVLEISAGYSDAMALDDPRRRLEYAGALVLVALFFLFVRSSAAFTRRRSGRIFVATTAVVIWYSFKEGFVRHDNHSSIFFFSVALLATVIPRQPKRLWQLIVVVAVGLLLAGVVSKRTGSAPVASVASFVALTDSIVSADRRDALRNEGLVDVHAIASVPSNVLADVRGHTVHVDPTETSAVWGYQLDWRPVPVFQRYSAYTAYLDELNASAVRGPRAPERILRAADKGIDGRNAFWDSPRYMLEMACRYRQGATGSRWGSFSRGTPRCGPGRALGRTRFEPGEEITVPAAPDRSSIVVARFQFSVPRAQRLVAMVAKPSRYLTVVADGSKYRIAGPHVAGPLLVRTRGTLGWGARFGGAISYSVLVPSFGGSVSFSAIPISD